MVIGEIARLTSSKTFSGIIPIDRIASCLQSKDPSLPDELLYDDEGSRIFDMLVNNPEYYLARQENDILLRNCRVIANYRPWASVVELGSGSSQKTLSLLHEIGMDRSVNFYPIDINEKIMTNQSIPRGKRGLLNIKKCPIVAVYESGLRYVRKLDQPKLILFLGSSTSQLTSDRTYRSIARSMNFQDLALIAFDLTNDTDKILRTYSLPEVRAHSANGITALNRHLAVPIDVNRMEFLNLWNERYSRSETHQYFRSSQTVRFTTSRSRGEPTSLQIRAGSSIRTAIQRKYAEIDVLNIIGRSGLTVQETLFNDDRSYGIFVVSTSQNKASEVC